MSDVEQTIDTDADTVAVETVKDGIAKSSPYQFHFFDDEIEVGNDTTD